MNGSTQLRRELAGLVNLADLLLAFYTILDLQVELYRYIVALLEQIDRR
jgi:hypothetical protein